MKKDFVSTVEGQKKMFYDAGDYLAKSNNAFMELVRNGLKKSELEDLISLMPNEYSRFSGFLKTLPE